MLLDGASRADVKPLQTYINQTLGLPLSALKVVVVTHMHPDHAGAAQRLRKLSGCQIVSAVKPHAWYRGLQGSLMHLTDIALTYWVAGRLGKPRKNLWYAKTLSPDIEAKDGDRIAGFEDWQIVETPGHTDRDLSILHIPTQQMYVADLIVKVKQRFIPPFPVFHPNQYRRSLEKLRAINPSHILLAHGGKIQLSEAQFDTLMSCAPRKPKTHWRATKHRVLQMLLRQP